MQEQSLLHLSVVTPYEIFYDGYCHQLVIPSSDGELGVMRRHAPTVVAMRPGELRFETGGQWQYCFVSNGYVQIEKEYAIVVCTAAEWLDQIDAERAERALARAKERYANPDITPASKERALHAIRRAKMRLKVLERAKLRERQG